MKARKILFTTEMIQRLLAKRKRQTRRLIKPQPDEDGIAYDCQRQGWYDTSGNRYECKHGKPGDILWVAEPMHYGARGRWDKLGHFALVRYLAGPANKHYILFGDKPAPARKDWSKHTQAMFMPRWASRITLEIVSVGVQRIQEISDADKKAEGGTAKVPFGTVWKKIHTKPGTRFEDNPWVWVIEFDYHLQNVDEFLRERGLCEKKA